MTNAFLNDPLMPHLLDILSDPASEGLILGGGFGIRLKQLELARTGVPTLISDIPPARATQDLDFLLRLEMFTQKETSVAFRALLERLGYKVAVENYIFKKPFDLDRVAADDPKVKVDLLARKPAPGEGVKSDERRVGKHSDMPLHGRTTPEAFAVDELPKFLPITGRTTDGETAQTGVFVPHPYASLNMKIMAAFDWLRYIRGELTDKERSEKHAFDVYILTAMLTEQEIGEASSLAEKYALHPLAQANKEHIAELYGSPDAQGFLVVRRLADGIALDYDLFREVLWNIFGA